MINDPQWEKFSLENTRAIGAWPNELWYNAHTKEGALVVSKSSRYGEYALSQAGLNYLLGALRAGRIAEGKVVLVNGSVIITVKPVAEVASTLEDVTPREGRLGPYWWMRSDVTPDGIGPRVLDEVPF